MYICLNVKYPSFMSDSNQASIVLTGFRKHTNFKFDDNPSSGAELFHADRQANGRTDRQTELNKQKIPFRIFTKALLTRLVYSFLSFFLSFFLSQCRTIIFFFLTELVALCYQLIQ